MLRAVLVGCLLVSSLSGAEYPQPQLLVEPATLAKPGRAEGLIILDARDQKKYDAGHIPGARWVDHASWAKSFGSGDDADGWSRRIGALGIVGSSRVVIYDDNYAKDAARIWWMLRYWGLEDVRLLNGGWVGWEQGKYPTEKSAPKFVVGTFTAKAHAPRLATKEDLLKSLATKSLQIVDARSEKEHCGLDALTNKRAGAIPGAKPLEWSDLLDKETQRFKAPSNLQALFKAAGIKLDQPTATHCQSGGRAAVMAFGLELMGAKDVKNYYKSWSEWGNDENTPIVKPEPKKK